MPYPSRGPWLFHNATGAFDFWPTLESVSISQLRFDDISSMSCTVVDEDASITFQDDDEVYVTFRGVRIWAGHVRVIERGLVSEVGPREWRLTGQDYTAKLDDSVILSDSERPQQGVGARINWILDRLNFPVTRGGIDLPSVTVDPNVYEGMTVREALQQVAEEANLHFYVDYDGDLHIFRNESFAAPFGLDDDANQTTTFPYQDWTYTSDTVELTNAVRVHGGSKKENGTVPKRWVTSPSSISQYGRQESVIIDDTLRTVNQVIRAGERRLAQLDTPIVEGSLTCWEPGLRAGMTIGVRNGVWGIDGSYVITDVEITAADPHDEAGEAYLHSAIRFTDKRRGARGPGGGGPGTIGDSTGGGGGGGGGRCHCPSNPTDPGTVDDFDRDVPAPTLQDGDALSIDLIGVAREGRTHGETPADIPFAFIVGSSEQPASYIGSWYNGHTSRPSYTSCGGAQNAYTGYWQRERWFRIATGTPPMDAAGIGMTVSAGVSGGPQGPGFGEQMPLEVVVHTSQPTELRQGTVHATLMPGQSKPIVLPIVAEGHVWVGFRTSWEVDRDDVHAFACGFTWPFASNSWETAMGLPYLGHGGVIGVNTPTSVRWLTLAAGQLLIGSTADPAVTGAPWDGPHEWQTTLQEGSPTVSVGNSALNFTSTAPSGAGFTVRGPGEDEDAGHGSWSDGRGSRHDALFSVDAAGLTDQDGLRELEMRVTGEGWRGTAIAHLGDMTHPAGVSVTGATESLFIAKAIEAGKSYVLAMDTRAGYVRAKLWEAGTPEPAQWDVEVPRGETSDTGDSLSIIGRVGNVTGEQTLSVDRITGQRAAVAGQVVVHELVGAADGTSRTFPTAHPYQAGSIRPLSTGIASVAVAEGDATYTLDHPPTHGAEQRVRYIAA